MKCKGVGCCGSVMVDCGGGWMVDCCGTLMVDWCHVLMVDCHKTSSDHNIISTKSR